MINPIYVGEIVSEIISDNCVLFLGSGLSKGAGLPSWRELICPIADAIRCPMDYDFTTIAQAYEQILGRPRLLKRICDATDTAGKNPTKVHWHLPRLRVNTWITTNYDDLLEISLHEAAVSYQLVVRDSDLTVVSPKQLMLIKLHGDRRDPDTIIVTKNDYYVAPLAKSLIWDTLKIQLLNKTFVFLGYSMGDPDFSQIQTQILYRIGANNFRHSYAVLFGSNPIIQADLESRKISIIDLGN